MFLHVVVAVERAGRFVHGGAPVGLRRQPAELQQVVRIVGIDAAERVQPVAVYVPEVVVGRVAVSGPSGKVIADGDKVVEKSHLAERVAAAFAAAVDEGLLRAGLGQEVAVLCQAVLPFASFMVAQLLPQAQAHVVRRELMGQVEPVAVARALVVVRAVPAGGVDRAAVRRPGLRVARGEERVEGRGTEGEGVRVPLPRDAVADGVPRAEVQARTVLQVGAVRQVPLQGKVNPPDFFPVVVVAAAGVEGAPVFQKGLLIVGVEIVVAAVVPVHRAVHLHPAGLLLPAVVLPEEAGAGIFISGVARACPGPVVVPLARTRRDALELARVRHAQVGRHAPVVRERVGEAAQPPVAVRAVARVGVARPRAHVFPPQDDVHHLLPHAVVYACAHGLVALAAVGLDVLDDVGGQVVECFREVAAREIRAVHHEAAHRLALEVERPVAQFQARHLADDVAQHVALRGDQGVEVVDHGVLLRDEEQARGGHRGFAQVGAHSVLALGGDGVGHKDIRAGRSERDGEERQHRCHKQEGKVFVCFHDSDFR